MAASRASDHRVFQRLSVRAQARYGGADVAARWRRRARERRFHRAISFNLLSIKFSPNFQTEALQTLNTKVVKQVTLFNNAKGSIGFYSPV
jgi:capsid protein